jgi:hypothetical protein
LIAVTWRAVRERLADRQVELLGPKPVGHLHRRYPAVDRVAGLLCNLMLHGVAAGSPADAELDRSDALPAVEAVMQRWDEERDSDASDHASLIQEVARAEFGRRGYEATTIRDIASAAGLSTGSVYRVIGSKEELLASIMRSFSEKVMAGWNATLGSGSTAVEKLDAWRGFISTCWNGLAGSSTSSFPGCASLRRTSPIRDGFSRRWCDG